ncbi:glycosyl hydrolase [Flavobacterium sp. IB48]|uniref:glycosyl hydrolase n=1 Tax=Flavobacterium sp. IB48 TaxID=2779375 RepID=UPI0018E7AE50|nr:glycosyl hydrolase [Flavobacterium sp. IB48]MBJ2127245.1 RICIN domain-containing protein [Flavobacterium sp. IB48]
MKTLYPYFLIFFLLTGFTSRADIFIEAESGSLNGTQAVNSNGGYTGTGYVGSFDNPGDNVVWTFNVPTAGLYEIRFRYNSPFSAKMYDLQVNAENAQPTFPQSSTWSVSSAGKYFLPAGQNSIKVSIGWGYFDIDNLTLVPAVINPPITPAANLTDANATPATKSLYNYMKSIYGNKILSGQQDDLQYIINVTGREPAVAGFDLMDYSPSRIEKSGYTPTSSESNIAWANKGANRGMISLVWHWNPPTDLIDQPGKEWWRGFYSDATTFDLQAVLADKNGTRYQLLLRDIDAIAVQLQKYANANIPVLFRPLHEASGGWFWWGAKGPGPFKELWQIMYNRLVNYHGLHNLIWVYTGTADAPWYPGNNYVDVFSLDIYGNAGSSMSVEWEGTQAFMQSNNINKMVALSETGNLPDPDKARAYGTWWSWYANWPGTYLTGQPNSVVQKMFLDNDVITLDELPDWRNFGGGGVRSPFAGVINLPGIVEAENFDNGGEGVAYHDTTPQNITGAYRNEAVDIENSAEGYYNLCFSDNGEWTEYTVNVTQSGTYALDARVASMAGGTFHLEFNGQNVTGALTAPNTGGWQNWQWVHKEVYLNSGTYVMRFAIDQAGFNTNGFIFTHLGGGNGIISGQTYRLVNRNSNQVLEIGGCNQDDGARAQQWPWLNSGCQKWKVESTDSGYYKLTASHSNKTLDIVGCSNDYGAGIQQWPWVGGVCEQWSIEPTDNGYYRIMNRSTGLALEVQDALTTNGANVRQWPWNTATCQQWKLEAVSATAKTLGTVNPEDLVNDEENISDIILFPNPASDSVEILIPQSYGQMADIEILDVLGKVQIRKKASDGKAKIDVSRLSAGIYIVAITNGSQMSSKKMIIRR